jgi:antitoxin (DNA-binding transcriptional repressor) of toxin-antitoxin stability system
MAVTATIRELRNHFPRVRQLVETEGEVVVTEQGTPKYRLTRYTPPGRKKAPAPKDYRARLRRHQPRPLTAAAARALHDANRGDR